MRHLFYFAEKQKTFILINTLKMFCCLINDPHDHCGLFMHAPECLIQVSNLSNTKYKTK